MDIKCMLYNVWISKGKVTSSLFLGVKGLVFGWACQSEGPGWDITAIYLLFIQTLLQGDYQKGAVSLTDFFFQMCLANHMKKTVSFHLNILVLRAFICHVCTIYNGNWTEWGAIWAEIINVISKSSEHTVWVQFELQVWFQTKIARHKVQLPVYYIHFEIAQVQDLVSSNILLMQYWASLKLNSSIFLGEKNKSFGNEGCTICHMILFVFHFPAIHWLL